MAMKSIDELMLGMVAKDATDLYITVGAKPTYSIHGAFEAASDEILKPDDTRAYAMEVLNPIQQKELESDYELSLSYSIGLKGRYRINVYTQRGSIAMVCRLIKVDTPTFEQLNLPQSLGDLIMAPNGLLLMTGATGSGKSTTVAAMMNYRNERKAGHIVTIEDPIEFLHKNKMAILSQREVGTDTKSFHAALKNTLRQAPQVIYIGEIRDSETMEFCMHAAETGHLVIGTLHSTNANQTVERIMNFFPHEFHQQIMYQLSLNLRAIISQRLIVSSSGKRVPALEIMIKTPYIGNLIAKGEIAQIKDAMEKAEDDGLQSFDQDLYRLWDRGLISEEQALLNADSANNLKLRLQGFG